VDEGVCHLQDGYFQVSLGRESAVPVWLAMGCLTRRAGQSRNPKHQVGQIPVDQTPSKFPPALHWHPDKLGPRAGLSPIHPNSSIL